MKNRFCHIRWEDSLPTATGEDSNRTSTEQVPNKYKPESVQVKQLTCAIGNDQLAVKEMFERLQLKHRPNFLKLYLTPAISGGWVRMLFPDSPRHPQQKYLLTVKGLAYYNKLKNSFVDL